MHFYGQPYEYFDQKDIQAIHVLYNGMHRITAQDSLRAFTVSDFPHLKQKNRDKVHRNLYKVAYPEASKAEAVTADKLKGIPEITPEMAKQWKARRNGKRNKSTTSNRHNGSRQKAKVV